MKVGLKEKSQKTLVFLHALCKIFLWSYGTTRGQALNSARSVRVLIRDSKKNPKKTALDLLKLWKSSQPTSINTVKRILKNYKMFGRIAAKKPMLRGLHFYNWIQWCKSYWQWHPSFCKDVIFSDEYRVEIYSRKREYVRRPPVCRYDEKISQHGKIWR